MIEHRRLVMELLGELDTKHSEAHSLAEQRNIDALLRCHSEVKGIFARLYQVIKEIDTRAAGGDLEALEIQMELAPRIMTSFEAIAEMTNKVSRL